jgi:small-conductance mechanosensitive channel
VTFRASARRREGTWPGARASGTGGAVREFGDNALGFGCSSGDPSSAQDPLASDLRYMACRALQEAGIVIAFPQRDLHFDEDRPLKIELSRSDRPRKPKLP